MDYQRLRMIGEEGFALLEELDARMGRHNSNQAWFYQYKPQPPIVYQVNPGPAPEEVRNNYDPVMTKHDGLLIFDYSKKSTAMAH